METLGDRIRYAMEQQGMKQADLARATGLSTTLVAQIVTGHTKDPRLSNVMKIADSLNVPMDYLAGRIEYHIARLDDAQ